MTVGPDNTKRCPCWRLIAGVCLLLSVVVGGLLIYRSVAGQSSSAEQLEGQLKKVYVNKSAGASPNPYDEPNTVALLSFVKTGPSSGPVLRKLLKDARDEDAREALVSILTGQKQRWLMPLFADGAGCQNSNVSAAATAAAEKLEGRRFTADSAAGIDERRRSFLDWWQREGKEKYTNAK